MDEDKKTEILEQGAEEKEKSVQSTPSQEVKITVDEVRPTEPEGKQHVSAGVIVLQWLSYAFWGWLILALIWLVGIIATNAITGEAIEGVVPYAMAAAIVLLPIAFFTDFFYQKHEPAKKTGASMVIMVIHAVIFALLAIGTLVSMVFILISLATSTSANTDGQIIGLWVSGAATFFYLMTLLRVLNPRRASRLAFWFGIGMLIVSIVLLVLAVVGPMMKSITLKDDRRIVAHLPTVKEEIDNYTKENSKLPDSLSEVDFASSEKDAKALVKDNLVRYKKIGEATPQLYSTTLQGGGQTKEYRYELCVTYKAESTDHYRDSYGENEYKTYLSAYSHPAGDVCYKLAATEYDIVPN